MSMALVHFCGVMGKIRLGWTDMCGGYIFLDLKKNLETRKGHSSSDMYLRKIEHRNKISRS